MANVESIKATIDANIVPNGNNSITGGILNQVLNEMADGTGECVREEVHEGVTYAGAGGIATPNIWYVMPDMADGKEDDIILTENNTKKINGQSLLGKGNLEIGGDVTELRNEVTAIQGVTDSLSSQLDSQQTTLNQQSAKLTELSAEIVGNSIYSVDVQEGVALSTSKRFPINLKAGTYKITFVDSENVISTSYMTLYIYDSDGNRSQLGINESGVNVTIEKDVVEYSCYAAANQVVGNGKFYFAIVGEGIKVGLAKEVQGLSKSLDGVSESLAMVQAPTDIAEFTTALTFIKGEIVRYNGRLYQFIKKHTAGEWAEGDVKEITIYNVLNDDILKKGFLLATKIVGWQTEDYDLRVDFLFRNSGSSGSGFRVIDSQGNLVVYPRFEQSDYKKGIDIINKSTTFGEFQFVVNWDVIEDGSNRVLANPIPLSRDAFVPTTASPLMDNLEITLPSEVVAVVGDTLQIFWRSIIGAFNPYIFDIVAECSVGKSYPRYYTFTPTESHIGQSYDLSIVIKGNDGNVVQKKTTKIKVVSNATSPSSVKNVLCIGASATEGGAWPYELKRRLTMTDGDGTPYNPLGLGLNNIEFVGRKKATTKDVYLEATGGWKVSSYASASSRALRFFVQGVNTLSIGSTYTDGKNVFVVQEINVTEGNGNIRCTLGSSYIQPSASGILTKKSGNGDATITYSSYTEETFSPFWNEDENRIDFVKYANDFCNGHLDMLIWHCGINDLTSGDASVIPSVISSFRELLDAYHLQFPNGKVIISSVPLGSVNGGFTDNYGASSTLNYYRYTKVIQKYAQALNQLCNESAYSSFVAYAPAMEEFDAENSYPTKEVSVNNRSTITEALGTNGVHPIESGSYMVADAIYRTINSMNL